MPPKKRSMFTKPTDETPAKRSKTSPSEVGKGFTNEAGDPYWEIGGSLRRVTVSEFNGSQLVSIREHYEKDGKVLPAKKGISLSIEQFNAFLSILPQLDSYLADKDVRLVRPIYGSSSAPVSKDVEGKEDGKADKEAGEVEEKPNKPAKKGKKIEGEGDDE